MYVYQVIACFVQFLRQVQFDGKMHLLLLSSKLLPVTLLLGPQGSNFTLVLLEPATKVQHYETTSRQSKSIKLHCNNCTFLTAVNIADLIAGKGAMTLSM